MATVLKGRVKWFNPGKGFGFLIPEAGNAKDIFIHYSNIKVDGFKTLNEGQEVTYEMGDGKGGAQAVNVIPVSDGSTGK